MCGTHSVPNYVNLEGLKFFLFKLAARIRCALTWYQPASQHEYSIRVQILMSSICLLKKEAHMHLAQSRVPTLFSIPIAFISVSLHLVPPAPPSLSSSVGINRGILVIIDLSWLPCES